ncbi:MAG TPA: hypothetical protein VKR26_13030, partial [Terriglobales bacterium]|nr:hypothetical protein [Terriglobales bacterium]
CVAVTVIVSYVTKPRSPAELTGLVYGFTPLPSEAQVAFYKRPAFLAVVVGVVFVAFNIMVW